MLHRSGVVAIEESKGKVRNDMKRPKNRDRSRLYICLGENFRDNAPIGDCGDVKTLMAWLTHLSKQDEEYLDRFFDDSYTNTDIVDYIYRSWGKRLKEVGK